MKMKKISLWMLGIAAMLTSCSQNEELLQDGTDNGLSTVSITAQVEDGVKTRATHADDDAITRCILQVREVGSNSTGTSYTGMAQANGSYKFTLSLKKGVKYDFLFWADDESYTATNLTAITLTDSKKPGIAYFGSILNTELTSVMTVSLTHAVAKVTVKTTGTLPTGKNVEVNIPTYTTFDVKAGDVTGTSTAQGFTAEYTTGITNYEVYSFYVLAPKKGDLAPTTIISCDGENTTLSNVPLQMNYRTVISGDIANINKVVGDITATVVSDWAGDKEEQVFPQINLTAAGTLTTAMLSEVLANGNTTLVMNGTINNADIQTLSDFAKASGNEGKITVLDMRGCTGATEIPNGAFENVKSLESVILPEGITTIGQSAFDVNADGSLASVTLPESLKEIDSYAFRWGMLTEIVIPANVTTIYNYAFYYQDYLKSITFKGQTPPKKFSQDAWPTGEQFPTVYVPKGCKNVYATSTIDYSAPPAEKIQELTE